MSRGRFDKAPLIGNKSVIQREVVHNIAHPKKLYDEFLQITMMEKKLWYKIKTSSLKNIEG